MFFQNMQSLFTCNNFQTLQERWSDMTMGNSSIPDVRQNMLVEGLQYTGDNLYCTYSLWCINIAHADQNISSNYAPSLLSEECSCHFCDLNDTCTYRWDGVLFFSENGARWAKNILGSIFNELILYNTYLFWMQNVLLYFMTTPVYMNTTTVMGFKNRIYFSDIIEMFNFVPRWIQWSSSYFGDNGYITQLTASKLHKTLLCYVTWFK